ncbi:hypothetical protein BDC45DRAFT_582992 [Circinella umbellata]|nr:hypothetical protein BDC45DRAFT_582992 [Circinella umbellata]
MDDNFDDFTERYSSTPTPVQDVPGQNDARAFNGNSTLWAEMGKMHTWINTAQSKFTHFEKLVETQGNVIDTVKKQNALLKQEIKELKEQVEKSTKKKTCSPHEKLLSGFMRKHYKGKMVLEGVVWNFDYDFHREENIIVKNILINYVLKTVDDLGYVWMTEVIEEKLYIVYKNEKYRDGLSLEQVEKGRKASQKNSIRNKKYHAHKNIYQENREALLAEFKDADLLIDRELMSDEEDLYDEYGVVEKKACCVHRDDLINKLDELLLKSKKRITGMKHIHGDQYVMEKELSKSKRTRLPSWAIVPLVEPPVLSVQPDNSEQHISPVQPEALSEQ